MKLILMKLILIFIFQLLHACSFAQFSLYRNKNFTDLYFNEAEHISTNCSNLPQAGKHYGLPGSIKTSQCVVFFNDVDCITYDSFLVKEDIPDLIRSLKLQRDFPTRPVSYRACLPSDKYLYPYPTFVFYTPLRLNSYPTSISSSGDRVKKIPVKPGCTWTFVSFNNVMALSPICVKLYSSTNCRDFGNISDSSITLKPWKLKSISYFGYVNSVKACDEEDHYKQHKKPKKTYDDLQPINHYNYTGGSSYGTGGSSYGTGGSSYGTRGSSHGTGGSSHGTGGGSRSKGGKSLGKLIFGVIGFLTGSGGAVAAVKNKNSSDSASSTDVATEPEVI